MARTRAHLEFLSPGRLRAQSHRHPQQHGGEADRRDRRQDGRGDPLAGRQGYGGRVSEIACRAGHHFTGASRVMIRVGIGGWVFAPWRGEFYPKGLAQARELEYASRKLTSIEINGTFYSTQKPESFRKWAGETPDDFVFSLKGPRYATHRRVLAEAGESIERFFTSGVTELKQKLGPVLWQLPPTKAFDPQDFAGFLALLPPVLDGRPIRHVVEVRHKSFA